MEQDIKATELGNVVRIDDERIAGHLGKIVRGAIEETLNALLEAEADRLVGAERYARVEGRRDHRSGHDERKLQTRGGEVTLKVPRLRRQAFETAIIERCRRRGARWKRRLSRCIWPGRDISRPVRRVEDITEALWGTRVSAGTVSKLNQKIYAQIEAWRMNPIEGRHPYVYLDGIVLKRTWAGEVRNVRSA